MFITLNIVFCFFITCLSIHPKVQEKNPRSGLLQSAIVTLYSTYLVFSAINSEPATMVCSSISIDPNSPVAICMLVLGVLFTFLAIIYSAISTGSTGVDETSKLISEKKEDSKDKEDIESDPLDKGEAVVDEPVTYNYTFFHITLGLAVMYLSMVLTNWYLVLEETDSFTASPSVAPTWVKMISSWVTLILYLWTLIAPLLFKDRVFYR